MWVGSGRAGVFLRSLWCVRMASRLLCCGQQGYHHRHLLLLLPPKAVCVRQTRPVVFVWLRGCLPLSFFHLRERLGEEGNGFGEGECDGLCCDSVTRGCSVASTALVRARCEALRHPRDTLCLLVFVAAGPSFVRIGPTRKTKQHCARLFFKSPFLFKKHGD